MTRTDRTSIAHSRLIPTHNDRSINALLQIKQIHYLFVTGILFNSTSCTMPVDQRIEMSIDEFNALTEYEDKEYLAFNYEERLVAPLFDEIDGPDSYESVFAGLTQGQKMLWSLSELNGQIANGGIAQYFWNQTGKYAKEAERGLEIIGDTTVLPSFRSIMSRGADLQPTLIMRNTPNGFADYAERLDGYAFDRMFLTNAQATQQRIIDYIKAHPEEFIK